MDFVRSFIFVYKYYSFSFHTEKLYFVADVVGVVVTVVGVNGGSGGDGAGGGGVALWRKTKYEQRRERKKYAIYARIDLLYIHIEKLREIYTQKGIWKKDDSVFFFFFQFFFIYSIRRASKFDEVDA